MINSRNSSNNNSSRNRNGYSMNSCNMVSNHNGNAAIVETSLLGLGFRAPSQESIQGVEGFLGLRV